MQGGFNILLSKANCETDCYNCNQKTYQQSQDEIEGNSIKAAQQNRTIDPNQQGRKISMSSVLNPAIANKTPTIAKSVPTIVKAY
jgi:hypothetical protein